MKKFGWSIFIISLAMVLFASIFFKVINIVITYDIQERNTQTVKSAIEVDNNANSNSTINDEVKTASAEATPSPISISKNTVYKDFSQLGEQNEKYSYSSLVWTSQSQVIYLQGKRDKQHLKDGSQSKSGLIACRAYEGDTIQCVITNCGVDADGSVIDVVCTVSNVKSYRGGEYAKPKDTDTAEADDEDHEASDFVGFRFIGIQYINDQTSPKKGDSDWIESDFTKEGHLVTMLLRASYASCDFDMTYYKSGTYNTTKQKANVVGVNGFFYDIDVPKTKTVEGDRSDNLLEGNEGIIPTVGSSTIYYDKNNYDLGNDKKVQMKEMDNGLCIESRNMHTNGIWFKTSAYMTTDLDEGKNGVYGFQYGGDNCGISYNFLSLTAFNDESINKRIQENNQLKTANNVREETQFNYVIQQYIPNNYYGHFVNFDTVYNTIVDPRYTSFAITDSIPTQLTITNNNNIKVKDELNQDRTDFFTINVSGNNVTVTAKEAKLQEYDFYSHTYSIIVPVQVKKDIGLTNAFDSNGKIINNASYSYQRAGGSGKKTSNNVETTLNYRISTQITHGTINGENDKVNIHENGTVTFTPNSGYHVTSVKVNDEEKYQESYEYGGSIQLNDVRKDYTVVVECQPISGSLVINKVDSSNTNVKLSNAAFTVYEWNNASNNYNTSGTTLTNNSNGNYSATLTYSDTNLGKFKVVETKIPEHYYQEAWSQEINIINDKKQHNFNYTIEVTNVHYPQGKVIVNKTDQSSGQTLSNVRFNLYAYKGSGSESDIKSYDSVEQLKQGSDGKYTSSNFEYTPTNQGKFMIVEEETLPHYYGSNPQDEEYKRQHQITLTRAQAGLTVHEFTWDVTNLHYPQGQITVNKTDTTTGKNLPGLTFRLYEYKGSGDEDDINSYDKKDFLKDNNNSGIYKTDVFEYTPTNKGKFIVAEEETLPGYYGSSDKDVEDYKRKYKVTLTKEKAGLTVNQFTWNLQNTHYPQGKVTVNKKDDKTQANIAGAVFWLYEYNGGGETTNLGNFTRKSKLTGENGVYTTDVFQYSPTNKGIFKVVETKAPEHYYGYYDEDGAEYRKSYDVTLTRQDTNVAVKNFVWDLTNTHYPQGQVTVNKTDSKSGASVADADFWLYEYKGTGQTNDLNSFNPKSKLTYEQGTYKTEVFEYSPTNKGIFKVVEVRAPAHYYGYYDEDGAEYRKSYDVTLTKDDTNVLIKNFTWSLTNTHYPQGRVTVNKTDKTTGNKLTGITFVLYEYNGSGDENDISNNYTNRGKLAENEGTYTTGVFEYTPTNQGKFIVVEEKTLDHYYGSSELDVEDYRRQYKVTLTKKQAGPTVNEYTWDLVNTHYPQGQVTINKTDSKSGANLADAEFWLYEYNGSGDTNNIGSFNKKSILTGSKGVYTTEVFEYSPTNKGIFKVVETKAPAHYYGYYDVESAEYRKSYDVTLTKEDTEVSVNKFTWHLQNIHYPQGQVIVNKTDKTTGKKLTGVTFGLYEYNGSKDENDINNYTRKGDLTENQGTYTSEVFEYTPTNQGKFIVIEDETLEHYYGSSELDVGDYKKQFKVTLTKKQAGPTVNEFTWDLVNTHYPQGKVIVNKEEEETKIKLPGALFGLYEYSGSGDSDNIANYNKKSQLVDSNGVYTSDVFEYSPINQGKFKIVEERAPEHYYGYSNEDDPTYRKTYDVVLTRNETEVVINQYIWNVTNVHYPQGKAIVNKTDKVTGAKLSGVDFELYEYGGEGDDSDISKYIYKEKLSDNGEGNYTSSVFEYTPTNQGKFKILEAKALDHYYGSSPKDTEDYRKQYDIKLTREQAGLTVNEFTWNLINTHYPRAQVTVNKTDQDSKAKLPGAIFALYEYKGEGDVKNLASYVEKSELTDNNGVYTSEVFEYSPTNQGKFKIVEKRAPEHYYGYDDRDDASYRKVYDVSLSKEESTDVEINQFTWDVTNLHYPQGQVTVNKTDEVTKEKLPGAIFALYEYRGSGDYAALSSYIERGQLTDNDNIGVYTSSVFEYNPTNQGRFKIVEQRAPEHYYGYSDEDDPKYRQQYDVTLTLEQAGPTVNKFTWNMTNKPYPKAQIVLRKTDSITSEVLDEAKFRIYEWNKNIQNWEKRGLLTDNGDGTYKTPGEYEEGVLEYSAVNQGKFRILEEEAPEYYTNPKTNINITLTEAGFHTYTYTNVDEYNVKDEPMKVMVQALKVDSETLERISGAEYTVYEYNKNTKEYEEYKINRQGEVIKLKFQDDRSYVSTGWLYANRRNEGKFRIVETTTPEGYYGDFVPGTQTKVANDITITSDNNGRTITIDNHVGLYYNTRVLGTISVNKIDRETNKYLPQGDATLDGAVYGLYAAENIVHKDTVTGVIYEKDHEVQRQTIVNGRLVFDNVEIGKYYIKEITAPVGYTPDTNIYNVNVNYEGETVAHLERQATVVEQVKKQAFQLVKLSGNTVQSEPTPLGGAGFKIYLIKDLSFVKDGTVKPDTNGNYSPNDFIDRDFSNEQTALDYSSEQSGVRLQEIFTDSLGKFTSPELAYGKYVVIETTVPEERYAIDPFIVNINEDNRTPQNERYFIDREFEASIKVNKRDAENGEIIINKDAAYRIWSITEGKYIEQSISYPKIQVVGTEENPYRINDEGYFVTPVNLTIGDYELREVKAPEGYVLAGHEGKIENGHITEEPRQVVRFTISQKQAYYEDSTTGRLIITVEQYNTQMKGELKLRKQGEYLTGARQKEDGNIEFQYELGAIENAEFEIRAKETIYSQYNPDVVVYEKDALVGTITTNAQGIGYVDNLPIGKYYIKETEAGYGFVLNSEQKEFEISYQAQETPTQTVEIEYTNERQKINLNGEEGIKVEKIADKKWYKPGETATYTIKVSNPTQNEIRDITVTETRINGEFEDINTDNIKKIDSTHVSIARLKAGESVTLKFSTQIGELEEGEEKVKVTNVVKAEGTTEIPDPQDPSKKITVKVEDDDNEDVYVSEKNILVIKEALKEVYEPGEIAQYIIHVINNGKKVLHNVETGETLIEGRFIDLEGSSVNGVTVTYKETEGVKDYNKVVIDKIEPGEEVILRYEYQVPEEVKLPVEGTEKYLIDNVVRATGTVVTNNPEDEDNPIEETVEDEDDEEIEIKENGKIGIIKQDIRTGERLKGAVFGLYADEDIRSNNGSILIKKDALIEKVVTNEQGQAIYEVDLPLGRYYIKEIEVPENYNLNDEKVTFNSSYRGQNVAIIDVSEVIANRRINTKIEKRNEDGELILGIELEILDEKGNVIESWTTDGDVKMFETLEKGKIYTLREKATLKGYTTADDIKFFVGEDGQLYQRIEDDEEFLIENVQINFVEMTNEKTKVELDVVDKETKEHISGIEVEIRDKKTGEVVYSYTTDDDVEIIEGLEIGDYDVVTKDPEKRGYVTSEGEIKVRDVKEVQRFVVEQDYTRVEISLKDEETKELLKGGVIEVVDEEGNVVLEIETEEQAKKLERLPVGKYTLRETEIPVGYHGAKDLEIEVKDTPELQKFEMLNRKKIFNISIKKKVVAQEYNGKRTDLNYDLPKLEIRTRNIPSADAWFLYIITVKNEGELAGKVEVKEYIPSGMQMKPERNPQWEVHAYDATLTIENLEPGETRELEVWLRYDNYVTNLGTKENKVGIIGTDNVAGFKETDNKDNEATASIIIAISTGLGRTGDIIIITLLIIVIGGISSAIIIQVIKQRKNKGQTNSQK